MIQSFSSLVALKLDEENYLPWKQQAEATIEGHDLLNHIIGKDIPKKFTIKEDQVNGLISSEYQHWKKKTRCVEILAIGIDEQAFHSKNGWL